MFFGLSEKPNKNAKNYQIAKIIVFLYEIKRMSHDSKFPYKIFQDINPYKHSSFSWNICKQCTPRPDAAASGQSLSLFAKRE